MEDQTFERLSRINQLSVKELKRKLKKEQRIRLREVRLDHIDQEAEHKDRL